jgi:fucose permease
MLIMSIAGGAIIPLVYGLLAEKTSTQMAYWVCIPCYLIILAFALSVHRKKKIA